MDMLFTILNLACTGFAFILTIFAAIKFRKERRFKPVALGIAALLSLVLLPIYFAISGIHLNFWLGMLTFALGGFLGLISGGTAKLRPATAGVIGKQSWLAFLIWGLSLILSMLVNLSASPVASALGALPLCFTTGLQFSANLLLGLRTLRVKRQPQQGIIKG